MVLSTSQEKWYTCGIHVFYIMALQDWGQVDFFSEFFPRCLFNIPYLIGRLICYILIAQLNYLGIMITWAYSSWSGLQVIRWEIEELLIVPLWRLVKIPTLSSLTLPCNFNICEFVAPSFTMGLWKNYKSLYIQLHQLLNLNLRRWVHFRDLWGHKTWIFFFGSALNFYIIYKIRCLSILLPPNYYWWCIMVLSYDVHFPEVVAKHFDKYTGLKKLLFNPDPSKIHSMIGAKLRAWSYTISQNQKKAKLIEEAKEEVLQCKLWKSNRISRFIQKRILLMRAIDYISAFEILNTSPCSDATTSVEQQANQEAVTVLPIQGAVTMLLSVENPNSS